MGDDEKELEKMVDETLEECKDEVKEKKEM